MNRLHRFLQGLQNGTGRARSIARADSTACHLHAEILEARELPSAVTAALIGNTLFVVGSGEGNSIILSENDGKIKVKGAPISVAAGGYFVAGIKSAKVVSIVVAAGAGDDRIDLSQITSKKHTTIGGGPGKDTITGSKWSDTIKGGKGSDTIIDDFEGNDTVLPDPQDIVLTPFDYYLNSASEDTKAALGANTGGITTMADGIGRSEPFEHGSLVWSPTTGAHEVLKPIYDKWVALNGVQSFLGYPTSDSFAANEGFASHFQGGDVYAATQTGAHEVHGDILARYNALGAFKFIGLPISDQVPTVDGIGAHGDFQSGMISGRQVPEHMSHTAPFSRNGRR
jgi:hypothetical protein